MLIAAYQPPRMSSMELTMIDCVSLARVPESQSQVITNLMQLYKYDFSEFAEVGSRYGEIGPDGRFTYEGLDSYWREDQRIPLTVHADALLAGFFFLRKYRRIGVGWRAAKSVFERWPGRWEVAVASYNRPALSFWRKAIPA